MEEWIQTLNIPVESSFPIELRNKLNTSMNHFTGIDSWHWEDDNLEVFFNPYEVSENTILENLKMKGLKLLEKKGSSKKGWKKFLSKMEKSNKKNFGNKRLDCCDLND